MILSDREIKEANIILPFEDNRLKPQGLSYGVSSYGYDARVGRHFKVFTNVHGTIVDPKNFQESAFVDLHDVDFCIIPPNSFALATTIELFHIPRDVLAVCVGKSTYARCGIILNVTPLEPEWHGYVTVEISNTTPLPCKIYSGEGIMQVLFFRGNPCDVSYRDKKGKYQGQIGITLPFVNRKD
jgi:dCTP deaminase